MDSVLQEVIDSFKSSDRAWTRRDLTSILQTLHAQYRFGLSAEEIETLLDAAGVSNDGTVDLDAFVRFVFEGSQTPEFQAFSKAAGDVTASTHELKVLEQVTEQQDLDSRVKTYEENCMEKKAEDSAALGTYYTSSQSMYEALVCEDTVLIKGSWLVEVASQQNSVLPRRQDAPSQAAWSVQELFAAHQGGSHKIVKKVVSISYCWLEPGHPDRKGVQLAVLARVASQFLSVPDLAVGNDVEFNGMPYKVVREDEAEGSFVLAGGNPSVELPALDALLISLLGPRCPLKTTDFAMFLDWPSMYQNPRSPSEQETFKRSLSHVNLWYASSITSVWMLTGVPDGYEIRPYAKRGWPRFERGVSEMITPNHKLLDLGLLTTSCDDFAKTWRVCTAGRSPPQTPDDFLVTLKDTKFTNGSDFEFVGRKYRETFHAVMGCGTNLFYPMLNWGVHEASVLSRSLRHCVRLRQLNLGSNPFKDAGLIEIAKSLVCCVDLRILSFKACDFGREGAEALAAALPCLAQLDILDLSNNKIGAKGIGAIAASCPQSLGSLTLLDVDMGDEGAGLLAEELPRLRTMHSLILANNDISEAGAEKLAAAFEKLCLKQLAMYTNHIGDTASVSIMAATPTADLLNLRNNGLSSETQAFLRETWAKSGRDADSLLL